MGWIYGSTIVSDTNSTASAGAATHQYDKIFSNKFLMENTATVDGVFLGRKVLVDYHQALTDTLNRVEYDSVQTTNGQIISGYFYWREKTYNQVSLTQEDFNNSTVKYYYLDTNNNYILAETWLESFDENTKFFIQEKPYTVLDLVSKASIPKGTYVYVLTGTDPSDITHFELLQCTSDLVHTDTNIPATFADKNSDTIPDLVEWHNKYITEEFPLTVYGFNRYIDQKSDKALDYSYDSTVWQKVYINNEEKYIMISQLNANNPTIKLHVKQPGFDGIASMPVLNVDNEDEYDFFVSSQSGFRIGNEPYYKVNVYIPGRYYIDDSNGGRTIDTGTVYNPNMNYYENATGKKLKMHYTSYPGANVLYRKENTGYVLDAAENYNTWPLDESTGTPSQDSHFVYLSDETCKYYKYEDNNTINSVDNSPAAIYYNKSGLNKEENVYFDTDIQEDSIAINFNGKSGYTYESVNYYEPLGKITEDTFNNYRSNLFYLLSDKGYARVDNYSLISSESYEPNKYYYYDENTLQYVLEQSDTAIDGRKYYKYEYAPYNNSLEYYLLKTTNSDGIDTHQLSINLPTIGNMVCEGWNLIYGVGEDTEVEREDGTKEIAKKRNLNRYEYNYVDNTLTGTNINKKEDNLTGLYNIYVEEVQRLKGYDQNTSTTTIDNIARSLALKSARTDTFIRDFSVTESNFNANPTLYYTSSDGENFTQCQISDIFNEDNKYYIQKETLSVEPLSSENIIQNQIANNNLGIESIIKQVGLKIPDNIGYTRVPNMTELSYLPNLYYYESSPNTFDLDKKSDFTEGRVYYTRQIDQAELSGNQIQGTLQEQINSNYTQRENNKTNITNRQSDIAELANKIGLSIAHSVDENNPNVVKPAVIGIKSSESENPPAYNTIQGQIYRNDKDIKNLMDLLGFTRGGENQGGSETEIINKEGSTSSLQTQITYNDYDIQKIVNRIRRIEEFLEDGRFLFTFGRKIKEYYCDNLQPLPGEEGYSSDDEAIEYIPF